MRSLIGRILIVGGLAVAAVTIVPAAYTNGAMPRDRAIEVACAAAQLPCDLARTDEASLGPLFALRARTPRPKEDAGPLDLVWYVKMSVSWNSIAVSGAEMVIDARSGRVIRAWRFIS